MSTNTVKDWVSHRFKEEYAAIREEHKSYVRANAEEEIRGITSLATDVVRESLRQMKASLERGEIDPKDLPRTAQQAMISVGISVDKSELLAGNPTAIVRTDTDDLQRELASVGITIVMPGQADTRPAAIDVQTVQGRPVELPERISQGKDPVKREAA